MKMFKKKKIRPPASPQQTASGSQAAGSTTQARPRLFPRQGTSPPLLSSVSQATPPPQGTSPADLRRPVPHRPQRPHRPPKPRLRSQLRLTSSRPSAAEALAHSRRSRSGAAGSPGPAPLHAVALGPRPQPQPPDSLRPPPWPFALLSQSPQLGIGRGPSTATSGFWSRKRKQSPPKQPGVYCHFEKGLLARTRRGARRASDLGR